MTNSSNIYYPLTDLEKIFIKSIWRLREYDIHQRTETILPKGTVEIIFNLSEKITYVNPTTNIKSSLPPCFINGINFKPFNLIKEGEQFFLGIQLNAIGLKGLLDVTLKEFNDNVVESSQVCKSFNILCNQLFFQETFDEQVQTIRRWIYEKVSSSKNFRSLNRVHWLFCTQKLNDLTVEDLCKKICISDRQLRRITSEWFGMNTEALLLYNKYLSSLYLLHNSQLSLTQIGLEAGYYDQSHFIREFKSYTDLTPKEYKASAIGLPGHIFG